MCLCVRERKKERVGNKKKDKRTRIFLSLLSLAPAKQDSNTITGK